MFDYNRLRDFPSRPVPPPSIHRNKRNTRCTENPDHAYEKAYEPDGWEGKTFAECLCERMRIFPDQYEEFVMNRCLYRQALVFRPLLLRYNRNFFAPDMDFVRRIGNVRRREDLLRELDEFFYHPRNGNWLRRRFTLRVSCRRVVALIREVMPWVGCPGSYK